ncbi:MAG: hypothetical protein IPJ41_14225 [Phycisphaerales bacterium]|nr:hypothetical protein [Phycisphaerales bacterium]
MRRMPGRFMLCSCCGFGAVARADFTHNIMLTGYWPPTSWMVERFSTNPDLNPDGWIGGNWEGRGYNVYSFFPSFIDDGDNNWGQGAGDFEVDYQDTSADWERITQEIKPAAIITFSRGGRGSNWEIESHHRLRAPGDWADDFTDPVKPTLDMPIFQSLEVGTELSSTLPMEAIRDAVADSGVISNAFIDWNGTGGNYLSEFIGLHGVWYNSLNSSHDAAWENFAAGHIHVGMGTPLDAANAATEITLRELTAYLDTVIPTPASLASFAVAVGILAGRRRRAMAAV